MMSGEDICEDAPVTLQLETFEYIQKNESLCALVQASEEHRADDVLIIQHTEKPTNAVFLGKLKDGATDDDISEVLQKVVPPNLKCMKIVSESNVKHSILKTVLRQLITVIGVEKLGVNNVILESLPEEVTQLDEFILNSSSDIKQNIEPIEHMVPGLVYRLQLMKERRFLKECYFEVLVLYFLLVDLNHTHVLSTPEDLKLLQSHIIDTMHFGRRSDVVAHLGDVSLEYIQSLLEMNEGLPDAIMSDFLEKIFDSNRKGRHYLDDFTNFSRNLRELVCIRNNLKNNSCNDLPDTARNHLTELFLNGNCIGDFPHIIFQCSRLKVISLNHNRIDTLPDNIGNLVSMRQLSLSYNYVKTLPQSIGDCLRLTILQVDHNKLEKIPECIGNLSQLEIFDASANKLEALPSTFCRCNKLTHMNIANNMIQDLPPNIGNIVRLEHFDASSNELKALPPTFCRCTELTYINVANNMIQDLPQNIGNLVRVDHFDLQANKVSCLPLTFDRMRTLRKSASKLVLVGNPLIHPPEEVCLQLGMYGIHSYLKELRRRDAHKMNHQKLVLVGETMAGKTSLAQTLMTSTSQLTADEQRTVVLEQHTWPAEGGLEIQINDFGGHDMYHLTSPCFFTPNIPYLLIFDIKRYTRQTHHKQIGSWMDVVRMKVPRAIIRMVGTHGDECSSGEIGEKLQYIAQTVQKDEAKWKADITSQLDMIESSECLGELAKQKRRECLQTQLNYLPNLHEPDSPVEIRTVSSSDFSGIDSLSSDIRELCKQIGSNRQDTIPKIWFDLHEMFQSAEYDKQYFVHLNDLQLYFKELDQPEAWKLHVTNPMQKLEFESDEFYMYDEESDIQSDDSRDDTTDEEEMNIALETFDTQSCVEVSSCLGDDQETNTAGIDAFSKDKVNKSDANTHQPLVFPSDECETVKSRDLVSLPETEKSKRESMCNAPVTSNRLIVALHYLNAVGLIRWYPDDEELKHLIFHRPTKLVDIFKAIVNHDIKNKLDFKNDVMISTVGQFSKQTFARAVQEFESTANLSKAIVKCLWHKLGFSKEDTESLIKLMIKFDICYEVGESEVAPGLHPSHRLHIPWYLSADPPQELSKMWPQPPPDDYQQLTMQYHFPTFCPRGLFERASVRLHRHIAQRVNWKNGVWAVVDNRQILLTRSTTDDESEREEVFTLSVRAPVTEQEPGHTDDITKLWKTFLSIHRDMQSLIQDWPGLRCDRSLQCAHCAKMGKKQPNLFPGEVVEQQCRQDVRTIPCPQYPVTIPPLEVRADLVYPPKSCMVPEQDTDLAGLASGSTDACASSPMSEMYRSQQEIDTRQQATTLVQKRYPGISFVPSRDTQDEAQRTQMVEGLHNQLTSNGEGQLFASVIDYSLDYEEFPTITERMRSVCLLECPKTTATGFLLGPRHILTNYHVFENYIAPAYRENKQRHRYVATFHYSSQERHQIFYNPIGCISCSATKVLDYAILELDQGPPNAEPLGQYVSEIFQPKGVVIVVGYPSAYGQRKIIDFCPIVAVDNDFEIHFKNAWGIPDNPDEFPQQVADRANYQTHVMFKGSSGSPGFDKSGNLVVMHTRGFSPYTGCPSIVEQGVLMTSIREHVKETLKNDELFNELFPPEIMDTG